MYLFNLIFHSKYFKKFISLSVIFFFLNNLLVAKAVENTYLNKSSQEEDILNEFYSNNDLTYVEHDKLDSQLKLFFGFDPENPKTSFYADLSIIDDSVSIRDMYKSKLNDMTINKIIYSIDR